MTANLDEILGHFRLSGHYYLKCTVLLFLAYISNCVNSLNYVFVAEEISYRCKEDRFVNSTCSQLNNVTDTCTEWIYDDPTSFVAELACQDWKRTLVGTVHSLGYMIGLLAMGPLSDRIGRKWSIVISGVIGGTFGILRSFTSWYWMYIALEFIEAAFGDVASSIFMLSIEIVAPDKRILFQMWCAAGFPIGFIVLPVSAWLVPYWRNLLRVIYSPALLFVLYFFLIDESPRWLLSRGKKDEAVAIINKIAKSNKVTIDKDTLVNLSREQDKEIPLTILLKNTLTSKTLLKRCLICLTWWTVSTFVNYGMQINSVSLEGNKYVIFGLVSIAETAANILTAYSMIGFRRKIPLILSFFLAGLSCFVQPFVPNSIPWLTITVYMFGKLMGSTFFYITYLYTSELFPTYTRNTMHSLCSSIGRIGSTIAPQTPLLTVYWHGLPWLVFGLASLLAGVVTLFAPETHNITLPDTVTEAEALGKHPAVSVNYKNTLCDDKNNHTNLPVKATSFK